MIDRFDVFCFDFDGTIGDTLPDIRNAWLKALDKLNWEHDHFDKVFRVGPPIQATAKMLYPDKSAEELELLQNTYKSFYDDCDDQIAQPYPGLIQLVKKLYQLNKRIYIVTNKRGKILLKMMRKFDLLPFIHAMFYPDVADKNNHIFKNDLLAMAIRSCGFPADRVLMIGDTVLDIEAAKVNNCASAAVTWGYNTREELLSTQPDYIFDSAEEFNIK